MRLKHMKPQWKTAKPYSVRKYTIQNAILSIQKSQTE